MSVPHHSIRDEGTPAAVKRAAAEWVVRRQQELPAGEEREFNRWLLQDRRHVALFAEMDETSQLLEQLRDPALAGEPVPAAAVRPNPLRYWLPRASLAAAAAVAVAWVGWWRPLSAPQPFMQVAVTEVGESRRLDLPDGSVLLLNTDSVVTVNYQAANRRVRLLHGEAFFTVAKDPSRPFWVEVGSVSVRAVGTAFNVRFGTDTVEVLVTEGKVNVNRAKSAAPADVSVAAPVHPVSPEGESLLVAGQIAKITLTRDENRPAAPMDVATLGAPRIASVLAWQADQLEFSDTPLAEVVFEFNRYNRHKLVIDDPLLARQTFGGAFAPNGYESLVEVLEKGFGVLAERRPDETILRKAH